jgi:transmembrane sensor
VTPIVSPTPADAIAETAARWAARQAEAPLRGRELHAFEAWVKADPAHRDAFEKASAAYARVGAFASAPDILAMRREALALEGRQFRLRPWMALLAAACIGALVFLPFAGREALLPASAPRTAMEEGAAPPAAGRDHYATRVGERLTTTLSDGSTITLNTNSEIRVYYSDAVRRIELIRGQAFFAVARQSDRPFVVDAGARAVRALGTSFEVRREDNALEVVLVEGRIAVGERGAIARGDLRRAIELQAGEQLIAARDAYAVAPVDAERATSWRSGRILFSATPLSEAVAEINRYRLHPLVVDDEEVAEMVISGSFRTADAHSFGEAVAAGLPVEQRPLPDGRTLLVRRDE